MLSNALLGAPAGTGTSAIVQLVPSNSSISALNPSLASYSPAAKHRLTAGQATDNNSLCDDFCPNGASDHVAPFHCSTNPESPTAKHRVLLEHATPSRNVNGAFAGPDTIVHSVPFQCSLSGASISTRPPDSSVNEPPTAEQSVALTHAIAANAEAVVPTGPGLGTTD